MGERVRNNRLRDRTHHLSLGGKIELILHFRRVAAGVG